jgi:hypothetical protein
VLAIFLLKARRPEVYRELPRGEALEELRREEREKVYADLRRQLEELPEHVREALAQAWSDTKELTA